MRLNLRKKSISLLLMLAVLMNTMLINSSVQATVISLNAKINLSKSADVTQMIYDEEGDNYINLNYSIQPEPIPIDDVPVIDTEKRIVLVIDMSGSMAYDLNGNKTNKSNSRIEMAKKAAVSFIEHFKNNSNVKIALVEYSDVASTYKLKGKDLLDYKDFDSLIKEINNIEPYGGTNIGDALRHAYNILHDGNKKPENSIVFLTDGEPTAFSFDNAKGIYAYGSGIGFYYSGDKKREYYLDDIWGINYNTGGGDANKYFVNWTFSGDYNGYSLAYAKTIGNMIGDAKFDINSYFIAFSDATNSNKLKEISDVANGTYKKANSADEIKDVYDAYASDIKADLSLNNVRFEETFSEDFTIIDVPDNMNISGQTVTCDFDNINYSLNAEGTYYEAEPINFTIKLAVNGEGEFTIGENKSSKLHLIDFDGSTTMEYFDLVDISVLPSDTLSENRNLNILELQPGRNFELNKGQLESAMSGYTINLVQMSISEFNGMIDEVNGLYDIIYIGEIEGYKDYKVKGNKTSITTDIDITNKKAEQIDEYIDSGQLIIFDRDVFSLTDFVLKNNFEAYINDGNVHLVTNGTTSDLINNIEYWYKNTNHRPTFNLEEAPNEYDGTDGSYEADHVMSYLYDAYNINENPMFVQLFIDIDGNGIFTDDEKVSSSNITVSTSGLALNYSLDDSFNGCMPWKLELVNRTTNTKAYQTGFTAFHGVKNIIDVLQLIPSNSSLDIGNENQFIPDLDTDDYQINITKMLVTDFDNNYPNPVNGNPTELNGNYDMIIFGFGDSYKNKDLHREETINAVDEFIQTGQSILFTHDTAGPEDYNVPGGVHYNDAPVITTNFKDDMGFSDVLTSAGIGTWKAWNTSNAYMLNKGLITQYPYVLANNSSKILKIATTHDQYWELNLEDPEVIPWFTLYNGNYRYYPLAYYYTFSKGNITYSGTGHSKPSGVEEQEMFVNTMLKASRGANHAPTLDVTGIYTGMNIPPSQSTINFKLKIHDIDTKDKLFTTKIYFVVDGKEILAKTVEDVTKEVLTELSVDKTFDLTVNQFDIKIVVSDSHDAQGQKTFSLLQRETPTLKITETSEPGFLIGDTIDVYYELSAVNAGDLSNISGILLTANIKSDYLQVIESNSWTVNDSSLKTTPSLINNDNNRSLTFKALKEGSADVTLQATYSAEVADLTHEKTLTKVTPIDVRAGRINVEVKDNLDRPIEGAKIIIKDETGAIVEQGTIDSTAMYKCSKDLKSGIYTVTIDEVPQGYAAPDVTEKTVELSYEIYNPIVTFSGKDTIKPIIYSYFDETEFMDNSIDSDASIDIHIKVDGVNSTIAAVYYKKLPDDKTTSDSSDFTGSNNTTNLTLAEDTSSPFEKDETKAEGVEAFGTFKVTENGYYAIYAINSAGNEDVKVIHVTNFFSELPDLL